MPGFQLALGTSAEAVEWADPALGDLASRLNPKAGRKMLRYRTASWANGALSILATVNGVALTDPFLTPYLYEAEFLEWPGAIRPVFTPFFLGSCTQQTVLVDVGHYVFRVARAGWGGYLVHIDRDT